MKKWLEVDHNLVREEYPTGDLDKLAEQLGVTRDTLRSKAKRLGVKRNMSKEFNPRKSRKSSIEFALELSNKFNLKLVGEYTTTITGCSVRGPCGHEWDIIPANLLSSGIGSICRECSGWQVEYLKWSEQDINKVKDLVLLGHSNEEIGKIFNTSDKAISSLMVRNNITNSLFARTKIRYAKICLDRGYTNLTDLNTLQNSSEYVTYKCDKGHIAVQILNNIISRGDGCPECCTNHTSKGELELLDFIVGILPKDTWIISQDKDILKPKHLDIVLPDLGIAFEYNGNYFHSDVHVIDTYHLSKYVGVQEIGYRLVIVTDEEWAFKNDLVKSRIKNMLIPESMDKIYARNCYIKEISYNTTQNFCINNHIQGDIVSSVNLGLFNKDILVAIMSFSKARFDKEMDWELLRFCSLKDTKVIGGASKLLKYFERNYLPKSLISYSDNRWNTGNMYIKLGMALSHTSKPNYRYVKSLKSFNRMQFQKHLLKGKFPLIYTEDKTEREIMTEAGYHRVYDCGNSVFIKKY